MAESTEDASMSHAMSDHCTIVHEGWLTKSPPGKRLWKSKWRQRWFVLRSSDSKIPGQYVLEYFEDARCKKRRGIINLDEVEQIDAGLSLQFESGGKCKQHVFDIKTPSRLYYLASKTEEEMKRWVDCICAACGLQIRDEAVVDETQMNETDYRYSPNPSSDQSGSGTTVISTGTIVTPTTTSTTNSGQSASTGSLRGGNNPRISSPPTLSIPPRPSVTTQPSVSNSQTKPQIVITSQPQGSSSRVNLNSVPRVPNVTISARVLDDMNNPYIPISECRSGRPSNDQSNTRSGSSLHGHGQLSTSGNTGTTNSVTTTTISDSSVKNKQRSGSKSPNIVEAADESYDIPRMSSRPVMTQQVVPVSSSSKLPANHVHPCHQDDLSYVVPKPSSMANPGVNWGTFPKGYLSGIGHAVNSFNADDLSRASIRSLETSSTAPRSISGSAIGGSVRIPSARARNGSGGPVSGQRPLLQNCDIYLNTCPEAPSIVPPSRPPKPATLRRSRGKSESCNSLPDIEQPVGSRAKDEQTHILDVTPKAPVIVSSPTTMLHPSADDTLIRNPKNPTGPPALAQKLAPAIKSKQCLNNNNNNNDHVTLSPAEDVNNMYSFPKSTFDLNSKVPPSASSSHPYLNSAPGRFLSKANVFTYDTLPTMADTQFITPDISPRTPLDGNLASSLPPQVNRNLKPRRKSTNSNGSSSSATNAACGSQTEKRISGKQKMKDEGLDIQYLDLDLDSDNSSPRTPSLINDTDNLKISSSNYSSPARDAMCHHSHHHHSHGSSPPKSSVYKEVDFVRTDALNKMKRQERSQVKVVH